MSYSIFEQLAVFCTDDGHAELFLQMSEGNFPHGVIYNSSLDTLHRGNKEIRITEISEKQMHIILSFLLDEIKTTVPINKGNVAYYIFDYCIRNCHTVREAKKLACRLISQYRRGQLNNSNFIFRGIIVDIVGMEPRSLLSKSGKSSYGRSLVKS